MNRGNKLADKVTSSFDSEAMIIDGASDVVLQVVGSNGASGTVKVVGSLSEEAPDFSQAPSVDNQYEYIQVIDLQDGNAIDGDIGIAVSADDVRIFDVNASGLRWLGIKINYTSGQFDVVARGYSNRK